MNKLIGLAFAAALAFAQPVAASPIIDFTGGSVEPNVADVTYGYSFTVTGNSVEIIGLGVFESFTRALSYSHDVGVWNAGGTLLASASVGGGDAIVPSTDALGQWRVADIAPLVLDPGTYYAGVHYLFQTENVLVGAAAISAIPGVSYDSARWMQGMSLAFPEYSWSNTLVGPVLIGTVYAPEPATLALFAAGLAVGFARRRRKSS